MCADLQVLWFEDAGKCFQQTFVLLYKWLSSHFAHIRKKHYDNAAKNKYELKESRKHAENPSRRSPSRKKKKKKDRKKKKKKKKKSKKTKRGDTSSDSDSSSDDDDSSSSSSDEDDNKPIARKRALVTAAQSKKIGVY